MTTIVLSRQPQLALETALAEVEPEIKVRCHAIDGVHTEWLTVRCRCEMTEDGSVVYTHDQFVEWYVGAARTFDAWQAIVTGILCVGDIEGGPATVVFGYIGLQPPLRIVLSP